MTTPTPTRDRYLALRALDQVAAARFYAANRGTIAHEAAAACDATREAEMAAYRRAVAT